MSGLVAGAGSGETAPGVKPAGGAAGAAPANVAVAAAGFEVDGYGDVGAALLAGGAAAGGAAGVAAALAAAWAANGSPGCAPRASRSRLKSRRAFAGESPMWNMPIDTFKPSAREISESAVSRLPSAIACRARLSRSVICSRDEASDEGAWAVVEDATK